MTPPARLRVTVRRGQRPGTGELTLYPRTALVTMPGLGEGQWLPRDQVPALLARVCGLAPRPAPTPTAALVLPRSTMDSVLSGPAGEPEVRRCLASASVGEPWVRRLSAVASRVESHWEIATLSADGVPTPWLEVVDAGRTGGLWSVTPASPELIAAADCPGDGAGLVALRPVTATTLWIALSTCATTTPSQRA